MKPLHPIIGSSPALAGVLHQADLVAPYGEVSVLIQGPTGSGKEALAHRLHAHSGRSGELVALDCGTLQAELAAAELFGYERGAFTGAVGAREGAFEQADGGTLFLDEVGELGLEVQRMLLRALQEGRVRRVGATRERQVDVRVVAATHRDLSAMVQAGQFREDLYHRLAQFTLRLPSLQERGEDAVLIAEWFLAVDPVCTRAGARTLSPEARALVCALPWPGNVRQLCHTLRRAAILHPNQDTLTADHLAEILGCGAPVVGASDLGARSDARASDLEARSDALAVPDGWLAAPALGRLAEVSLRVAELALSGALQGRTWRGTQLCVRTVPGRGGRLGFRMEVLASSLPPPLYQRWVEQQGALPTDIEAPPRPPDGGEVDDGGRRG